MFCQGDMWKILNLLFVLLDFMQDNSSTMSSLCALAPHLFTYLQYVKLVAADTPYPSS